MPDLGDAPDSTNSGIGTMWAYSGVQGQFPTVYGAGSPPYGPKHLNNPLRFNLGELITAEDEADTGSDQDGINNLIQGQADNDGQDDGVTLPDFLDHCTTTSFTYTVRVLDPTLYGTQVYLNAWFDFNRDGQWGGTFACSAGLASEWAVQNHAITLGSYYASFTSPTFYVYNTDPTEDMWVRVTLSDSPASNADGSGPAGGYKDGETEDYLWIAPWDIEVTAVEVSQGIQNLDNDMPLVADRNTIVRVYVQETTGRDIGGVSARLYGERGGSSLSDSPIEAENNPITVRADGGDRLNLDDSFWFVLPDSWLSGDVTLRAEVNYDDAVKEADKSDNEMEVDVTFHDADPLNIVFSPLHLHEDWDRANPTDIYWCTESDCDDIYYDVLRYHPVSEINIGLFSTALMPSLHGWPTHHEWDLNRLLDKVDVLARLQIRRWLTTDTLDDPHYYGMVHADFEPDMSYDGYGDVGGRDAFGIMSSSTSSSSPWHIDGGVTMAHELGHNQGLKHVECSGTENNPDTSYPWPYPDCSLADVDSSGYYGLDVYYEIWGLSEPTVISNDPNESAPHLGYPFMGYLTPSWVSPWEYCKLLEEYGVSCGLSWSASRSTRAVSAETQAAISALQNADEYILVSGVLDADHREVHLASFYRLSQPPPQALEETIQALQQSGPAAQGRSWRLTLDDASGQILYSHPIAFNLEQHGGEQVALLNAVLPFPGGTHWVRVREGDTVVAEREVSAHVPQVQVLWPNGGEQIQVGSVLRWSGSDADGDDLTYTLLYSPDAGNTWRALALDVTDTEMTVDEALLDDMVGSRQALLKVLASDGVNTGQDVSDGTFSAPGSAPKPLILNPRNGTVRAPGEPVLLMGVALDMEEGTIRDERLRWYSDRDGFLGSGRKLKVSNLSAGRHRITLRVQDADGMTGETSVTLYIGRPSQTTYLPMMLH
ncbi:MAG: hypothetical protein D6791_18330 [Chloroflexi bacterium]|nr:MAG: hypothetical protein D6791_18330 [Chloroflexota bacterium]